MNHSYLSAFLGRRENLSDNVLDEVELFAWLAATSRDEDSCVVRDGRQDFEKALQKGDLLFSI